MDENEYLQRFRLAILWDEYDRREHPPIKGILGVSKTVAQNRRARLWRLDRKNKRLWRLNLNWMDLFVTADNVRFYARWALENSYPYPIDQLRLTTWMLKQMTQKIRDIEVRDYYEHLVFVAEETLKMLDRK